MFSIYRDTLPLLLDDDAISLRRCQQKPPPFEVSFSLAQLVEFLFFYYGRQIKSKLRLISIFLGMIFHALGVFGMVLYFTLNKMILHNSEPWSRLIPGCTLF